MVLFHGYIRHACYTGIGNLVEKSVNQEQEPEVETHMALLLPIQEIYSPVAGTAKVPPHSKITSGCVAQLCACHFGRWPTYMVCMSQGDDLG